MSADLFAPPAAAASTPPRSLEPVPALLVEGRFVPRCAVCRATAHFGFFCDGLRGQWGIWFCGTHKGAGG